MSLRLSRLLSDGMVLQRGANTTLWGSADEPVTIHFLGQRYHALPDAEGNWKVTLDNLSPGGPFVLRVNDIALQDVYVGDVWLCTGQSNMQLPMSRVRHRYPEAFEETIPCIRQFTVPQRTDFHALQTDLEGEEWQAATPETLESFTAVGYFFAKRLYQKYRVPIGLLLCAIGGTPIHAWMSRDALAAFPELLRAADRCGDDQFVAWAQAKEERQAALFYDQVDRTDPGLTGRWFAPDAEEEGWEDWPLLKPWEGCGSVWLRKTLRLPPELAGQPATLFLGTVTDWDTAYVDGAPVGCTTYRYPPREYRIPALPSGPCTLAIRAISMDGGGFTSGKQYVLSTALGCVNLNGMWKFRPGGHGEPPEAATPLHCQPIGLYGGMLHPLQRYGLRGAIWYQGESDADNPDGYAEKCAAMVRDWRKGWGFDFPFLFVELAHWDRGAGWRSLKEEQWRALESIPFAAMAAADDLGEYNDLHPLGKQPVGDRLARLARRLAYGETLPPSPFELIPLRGKKALGE